MVGKLVRGLARRLLAQGFQNVGEQAGEVEEIKQQIEQCQSAIEDLKAGRPTSLPVEEAPGEEEAVADAI
jgi:hypothetical protein